MGLPLPRGLALFGSEFRALALDVIDPGELLLHEFGDLALVGCVQVEELASGVRQTTDFRQSLRQSLLVPPSSRHR